MKSKSFYWIIIIISIIVIFYNLSYISFCREGYTPTPGEIYLPIAGSNLESVAGVNIGSHPIFKRITAKNSNKVEQKRQKLQEQINISKKIKDIFNFDIIKSIKSKKKYKKKRKKFKKHYINFCKVGFGNKVSRVEKCEDYFKKYLKNLDELMYDRILKHKFGFKLGNTAFKPSKWF